MKMVLATFVIFTAFSFRPSRAWTGEASSPTMHRVRGYLGGGFLYDFEQFRGDIGGFDWDDSWGFNLRGGAYLSDYFALEGLFQYHHAFELEEPFSGYFRNIWIGPAFNTRIRLRDYDFFVNGKACLPLGAVRPYAAAGIGWTYSEAKLRQEISFDGFELDVSYTASTSAFMWRAGAGLDAFLSEHVGLNVECAYQAGLGDLDDLRFLTLSAGVSYLF